MMVTLDNNASIVLFNTVFHDYLLGAVFDVNYSGFQLQFLAPKEKSMEVSPVADEGGDVDDLVSTLKKSFITMKAAKLHRGIKGGPPMPMLVGGFLHFSILGQDNPWIRSRT